jgi:hypothetical protein
MGKKKMKIEMGPRLYGAIRDHVVKVAKANASMKETGALCTFQGWPLPMQVVGPKHKRRK